MVVLIWDEGEGHYVKRKFNVSNFAEVLHCLEIIQSQAHKFNTEWANPADFLHLSESMQSLRFEDTSEDVQEYSFLHNERNENP